jgi:hypothetical protein
MSHDQSLAASGPWRRCAQHVRAASSVQVQPGTVGCRRRLQVHGASCSAAPGRAENSTTNPPGARASQAGINLAGPAHGRGRMRRRGDAAYSLNP